MKLHMVRRKDFGEGYKEVDYGLLDIQLSSGDTITLRPCAKDAYYLFQDLCLLTNSESPEFLRLTQLSKTFGLELIESVLTNHYMLFRTVSC